MGICAAAFLPAYFCALYWKRATKQGVIASLCNAGEGYIDTAVKVLIAVVLGALVLACLLYTSRCV